MTGPGFFMIGAAKAGTTAVYRALQRHPEVFLPEPKEPHVYAFLASPETVGPLYPSAAAARGRLDELYAGAQGFAAVGDASTSSLVVPGAAAAIAADVPEARIVVILRHPVDRAFSHWAHFRSAGAEDATFREALDQEDARMREGWPHTYRYRGWGRYGTLLEPYYARFGRDRILVHLYEDLERAGDRVMRDTLGFLGVDPAAGDVALERHNVTRGPAPAARWRDRVAARIRRSAPPALDPALRAELSAGLRHEIGELEERTGRDLSHWL